MLSIHPITLADKSWVDGYVYAENPDSADFTFGNMFLWDQEYTQLIGELGGRMIVMVKSEAVPFFAYPIGTGPLEPVIGTMRQFAREQGFPFVLSGLMERSRAELEGAYPGRFRYRLDEVYSDYIYSAEKLATLAGKKLHKKRNHIHQFERNVSDWQFEPLERKHFEDCLALLHRWSAEAGASETAAAEYAAIQRAFEYYEPLGLDGGILRAEGRIAAFTVGERIGRDVYLTHFEKADGAVEGAYAMINREFARLVVQRYPDVRYINREDDLGLENLRKAKMSYYPEYLVHKYTAVWTGEK